MKIVVASGGFDPLHVGHIEYLQKAKELGDILIVSVARDKHLLLKKEFVFMQEEERAKIIEALSCVDVVGFHKGEDGTTIETLKAIHERAEYLGDTVIFAKGGDRYKDEIAEKEICKELGIEIVDGLGEKIQSSSWLLKERKRDEE